MNDKKFYNMKIYSKPKIYVNGYNFFYVKHYNKIPKISNNDLDDCYAIIYNSVFNYYYLIHITKSKFIDDNGLSSMKSILIGLHFQYIEKIQIGLCVIKVIMHT